MGRATLLHGPADKQSVAGSSSKKAMHDAPPVLCPNLDRAGVCCHQLTPVARHLPMCKARRKRQSVKQPLLQRRQPLSNAEFDRGNKGGGRYHGNAHFAQPCGALSSTFQLSFPVPSVQIPASVPDRTLLYTPASMAFSSVVLPWKPPPTISVTPRLTSIWGTAGG